MTTMLSLARLQLRRWREAPGRTVLSLCGVAVGSALVVAVTCLVGSLTGSIDRATAGLTGGADVEISGASDGGFDSSVTDRVAAVDGVASAAPLVRAIAQVGDQAVLLFGVDGRLAGLKAGPFGSADAPATRRLTDALISTALTDTRGVPILVGPGLAKALAVHQGDVVRVTFGGVARPAVVAAIVDLASASGVNQGSFAVTDIASAQALTGRPGRLDSVLVKGGPRVDRTALRTRIRTSVAGQAVVADTRLRSRQARASIATLQQGMTLSASMAVAVGGFLVYATMSMAALERRRELATMRAMGGRRRQLLGAFLAEAAVLGSAGSVIGIAVGIAIARPLVGLFPPFFTSQFGVRMGFVLPPTAVPLGVVAGLGATMLAAVGPGRRAVSVPPVESMRPEGVLESGDEDAKLNRRPLLAAIGLLVAAMALLFFGPGASPMAGFAFIMVAIPTLARGVLGYLTASTARVAGRLGAAGSLAATAIAGAPRRVWVVSSAFLLAGSLVVAQGHLVAGTSDSISARLGPMRQTGLIVDADTSGNTLSSTRLLPEAWRARFAAVPGVTAVRSSVFATVTIGEDLVLVQGVEEGLHDDSYESIRSSARPALLAGRGIVLSTTLAVPRGFHIGDTVTIQAPGGAVRLPVVDLIPAFKSPTGIAVVSTAWLKQTFGHSGVSDWYLDLAPGTDVAAVRAAALAITAEAPYPVGVVTGAQFAANITKAAAKTQVAFVAMQWVIVLASVLAVLNALLIAVVERRREIGILRALGTSRRRLRDMVIAEAVAVGLVSGTAGMAFGFGIHVFAIRAVGKATNLPLIYQVHWQPPATAAAAIAGAALLGSWLPARRAAGVEVLAAIGYE